MASEIIVSEIIVIVLLGVAGFLFLIAICGMFLARRSIDRLHFLAVISSAVVPLVAIAAAVREGFTLGAATALATGLIVAVSSPALSMAVGRAVEQERHADTTGVGTARPQAGRSPE
ncbi:monovalent cation/H(+) antiporter subunit G [Rathayibacter soli]|uniref:monovalent cation/H(+) antiporter subunit G n=1 Tax=Rathayibacter soli TaxID=3144168 RepID=UPI0027E5438D|nr:monovalent cation/H(+) antiporter subunit G [Glaciibacter superstes]